MTHTKHTAILLDRLLMDYVTLRATYPTPKIDSTRTAPRGSRTYGHPAQWASDQARKIADCLDSSNEALRDHLNHLPPPHRNRAEARVVNYAYQSLKSRLEYLPQWPGYEDFLTEARDIHYEIRRALGHTRQRSTIGLPCPNCSSIPVFRTLFDDHRDVINCEHCGYEVNETEYGLFVRIVLDDLLDSEEPQAS